MNRLYVGSEVGQLRRVLLNRPERALTHLTPSNCHELLFDDVLAVFFGGRGRALSKTTFLPSVPYGIFQSTALHRV